MRHGLMPLLIVKKKTKEIRRFFFYGDIITIGRDSFVGSDGPDLTLIDPSRKVSRHHAAIIREKRGGYFIRDLGSANGTFVDGTMVYDMRLRENNRITIGNFDLVYSKFEKAATDLSQAIRVVKAVPMDREGSRKTELENLPEVSNGRLSEVAQQTLHDIVNRLITIADFARFNNELLNCAVAAVQARRGVIAGIETPFSVVPEAIHGLDLDNGEQMNVSREYLEQAVSKGETVGAFFAGTAILCSSLDFSPGRKGIIYLECDRGGNFTEENKILIELLCRQIENHCPPQISETVGKGDGPELRNEWAVDMVAKSPEMRKVVEEINACTEAASNVLLQAETGAGKEITARTIHNRSPQADGPFVVVELSNLEREMVSSTLFGWVKGGFTGADRDARGAFEEAGGGTIFLDEIGDVSSEVQVKLRRAVEEKEIFPVGLASAVKVNVKVIAATNADLDKAVLENKFRADLIQRFGKRITIPPLRERKADIPLLVYFFIDKLKSNLRAISHGAMRLLVKYEWPGNVRELRELVTELATKNKEFIFSFDLPDYIQQNGASAGDNNMKTMQETERQEIIRVLNMAGWNKTQAARILGFRSKQTLYNKIKKFNITDPRNPSTDES
jgi:DNA-binding NtrC family response regulator